MCKSTVASFFDAILHLERSIIYPSNFTPSIHYFYCATLVIVFDPAEPWKWPQICPCEWGWWGKHLPRKRCLCIDFVVNSRGGGGDDVLSRYFRLGMTLMKSRQLKEIHWESSYDKVAKFNKIGRNDMFTIRTCNQFYKERRFRLIFVIKESKSRFGSISNQEINRFLPYYREWTIVVMP